MGAFIRCRNFNPRSYKRSDFSIALARCSSFISIHAPTRGATIVVEFCCNSILFQSTLLQEERHIRIHCYIRIHTISIHAPTRGATGSKFCLSEIRNDFNPRSYKRSDQSNRALLFVMKNFNPRSYKRSDPLSPRVCCYPINFNPRSYKRSDDGNSCIGMAITIFQSTLLQEERRSRSGNGC